MNPDLSQNQRHQLEALAEEYATRKRHGEDVDIEQYVNEHPEMATDIRDLFPIVLLLDKAAKKDEPYSAAVANAAQKDSWPTVVGEIGPGTRLGEYQLIRQIGRGGMGVVYQAEHIVLGNHVAIKLLPSTVGGNKSRERFQREASAAARMHHPNIVRVFDFGAYGETLYYVMSLVEGWGLDRIIGHSAPAAESSKNAAADDPDPSPTKWQLSRMSALTEDRLPNAADEGLSNTNSTESDRFDLIDTNSNLPDPTRPSSDSGSRSDDLWNWVSRIGIQAADALTYAHSQGVVHRDIKPSNLMIDADNTVYVTDFGLAKVSDDSNLTETGDVMGTLRYMAPEAFSGRGDHRSDIYGLGLTLYELLCNEQAFVESDRARLIPAITDGQVTRLRKRVPRVPLDLATIVHKAIDAQPSSRYESAAELRDDLRRFLNSKPVKARRATWAYRTARWIGRNRVVSALAATVMLLLATAAITSTVSARRFEQLAGEKELERVAARNAETEAAAAEQAATVKTREAQLNLLAAKISDARGWSTSRLPGQRVEGMRALKEAIALARELKVFANHQFEINEIATTLSTLCDMPPGEKRFATAFIADYTGIGFNDDLTEYAFSDYRDGHVTCQLYSVVGNKPELLNSIPMPDGLKLDRFWIQFSRDSRFVFNVARLATGEHVPWIYDREKEKHLLPEFELSQLDAAGHICILSSGVVVFVNSKNELIGFDPKSNSVQFTLELPGTENWSHLAVSHDSQEIAIYELHKNSLILVNVASQNVRRLAFNDGNIEKIAWRPDGLQLGILTINNRVSMWDISGDRRNNVLTKLEYKTTHLGFSSDGRFLLATGWTGTTAIYGTCSGMLMLRAEKFMMRTSRDGKQAMFHSQSGLEIRDISVPQTVTNFYFPEVAIDLSSVADSSTGILWASGSKLRIAYDFIDHRVVDHLPVEFPSSLTVDPLGRDILVSSGNSVLRLPVQIQAERIQIGPPETILEQTKSFEFSPKSIRLDAMGQRLAVASRTRSGEVVLDREQNWNVASHTHATARPIDLHLHPNLPLVSTTVHLSQPVEVRNWENDTVQLSIQSKKCRTVFTPDGSRILVSRDGIVESYDVGSWKKVAESDPDWNTKHYNLSVSADSRWVAVENQSPRGVLIFDSDTLQPSLLLRGNHLEPRSNVAQFDPSGRFLVCNRGKNSVGVWDFYKLRQHFESLDLEWPLPGLGNPTPLRDPSIPVEIIWDRSVESVERSAKKPILNRKVD